MVKKKWPRKLELRVTLGDWKRGRRQIREFGDRPQKCAVAQAFIREIDGDRRFLVTAEHVFIEERGGPRWNTVAEYENDEAAQDLVRAFDGILTRRIPPEVKSPEGAVVTFKRVSG